MVRAEAQDKISFIVDLNFTVDNGIIKQKGVSGRFILNTYYDINLLFLNLENFPEKASEQLAYSDGYCL